MAAIERPRVEGEREDEILAVTADLLLEVGYDRLTMDEVARRARASKATLYRRWESKPRLVVQAMVRAGEAPRPAGADTGSLRGDLLATFCKHDHPKGIGTEVLGSVITALATDTEFATAFREEFITPKVQEMNKIYLRARERGEIADDADLEVIGPALPAILMHQMFVLGTRVDDATVRRVVDHVIMPAVQHPPASARDGD